MSATVTKKRKISTTEVGKKFYGVRAGHTPGVYTEWNECKRMITGFKGAAFKSFLSEKEAQDFVAGKSVTSSSSGSGDRFYGVATGKVPGVYTEWTEAQEQIIGVNRPKYKKFPTYAEAEAFVKSGGKNSTVAVEEEEEEDREPSTKRKKVGEGVKGKSKVKGGVLKVWTDGSSRGNGRAGAQAGYGVWFGYGDDRNVAARLPGLPQTNQRAELTGMLRALEIVPISQPLEIISDSNYSINCATIWYKSWMKNGWKSSTGQPVANRDIVEKIRAVMNQRDKAGVETRCTWVKGHNEDVGNTGADELAVAGSRLPALD